jgi:hypothetical protein
MVMRVAISSIEKLSLQVKFHPSPEGASCPLWLVDEERSNDQVATLSWFNTHAAHPKLPQKQGLQEPV